MPFFILNDPGKPSNPFSYSLLDGLPLCGKPKKQICYIEADADPNNEKYPLITREVVLEFITALSKKKDTEHVFLKPK